MRAIEYLGLECLEIEYGDFQLIVTKSVGPRILSFRYKGCENILAELPGEKLTSSGSEDFYFYGGHRLWISPEIPALTYLPDNSPISATGNGRELQLAQSIEFTGGWVKSFRIKPSSDNRSIIVDHFIQNSSQTEVEIAPWAITQLKLGGTAILPQPTRENDNHGFQPNRLLVLWPYTKMKDHRIHWGDRFVLVNTDKSEDPLKIGIFNQEGWLAYYWHNLLFIKFADCYQNKNMPDFNATSQCYTNSKFLELETLGPKKKLKSGEKISHREVWTILEAPHVELSEQSIIEFIKDQGIINYCKNLTRRDEK